VVPSTCALFFFRVKAVYCNDRTVAVLFGIFWFAVLAVCFLAPPSVKATHIGRTQMCVVTKILPYGSLPVGLSTFFNTFVFIAISLRIVSYSIVGDTFAARVKSFIRGDGLPSFSRSLLRCGQCYYSSVAFSLHFQQAIMLSP
jgi:hypothetical protein